MHAFLGDRCLGKWIRTDLGVRTFQGLGKTARQENKWFVVSLEISIPDMSWKICFVILTFRCRCNANAFLPVVLPRVTHGTHRLLLSIACFLGLLEPMSFLWIRGLPVFLRGGGVPPPFQNLKTPQSAAPWGRELCLLWRQFVEDAEQDGEEESGTGVSELNVKEMRKAKGTRSDHNCDVSGQEGPRTLNEGTIKALRTLIEDFENQLQCQNDDSTSDEEQEGDPPQEMAVNSIALFPDDEEDDEPLPSKEPQLCVTIGFSQWQR